MNYRIKLNIIAYSFIAGFLACLVSLFIKFAFNIDNFILGKSAFLKLSFQAGFIGLSFIFNGLMWLFYTKSLNLSSNTLYTTALNKFSNFICSALFGYFVFNENLQVLRWLSGIVLLFVGIIILNQQQDKKENGKISQSKQD